MPLTRRLMFGSDCADGGLGNDRRHAKLSFSPTSPLPSPPGCGGRGRGPVALATGRVRWAALALGTAGPPTSPRPSPPSRAEREVPVVGVFAVQHEAAWRG